MRLASLFCLATLLPACAEDVAKDKAHAVVADVPAPEAPSAPVVAPLAPPVVAGSLVLQLNPASSSVVALGAKITDQHALGFPALEGTMTLEGNAVTALTVTVRVAELSADPAKLAKHLVSPDFLDAAQYPSATFVAVSVTPSPAAPAHSVVGDLTLHGVTKRLTFPATVTVTDGEARGQAEFSINRQDYGISYPGKPDDLIQDNVLLTVNLVATR